MNPTDVNQGAKEWKLLTEIFPEDVNRRQTFDLTPLDTEKADEKVDALKMIFQESSDFFGRITVYDLKVEGIIIEE